ncbi:MAG TPA: hypothetical protein VM509_04535, partial [Planctomycetota bacterium]|nr:hypothetical protein [Planctomycetota bacterium]
MEGQATEGRPAESAPKPAFKWGFASSGGVILALLVVGQVAGNLLGRWPPMRGLLREMGAFSGHGRFTGSVIDAMRMKDWLFAAFLVAAVVVAWLNRAAIARFFRSMQTGVMLIALATLAILTGVLVPQIQNFEDPEQRITAANYKEELGGFEWAQGYFLYHILHLYGIGMPPAEMPPGAAEGLVRFGRVYGAEEQKNREVQMRAAVGGVAKTAEIEQFIRDHRVALRRAFDVCTALDLNRTYKSSWFATLVWLLGIGVLINTFRYPWRVLFTVEKAGFFVTHVGMLTMLSGGLVSSLFTDRGILELHLGEGPKDTYFRHYRIDKRARMPFGVELERFARKEWKAIDVYFPNENFQSRPPRYTVWPGRKIPLDWQENEQGEFEPRVELVVRELHEHAKVQGTVNEGKPGDGGPTLALAELDAPASHESDGHGHHDGVLEERTKLYMAPEFPDLRVWNDPAGKFRLGASHGGEARAIFPAEGDQAFATLWIDVRTAGLEAPQPYRIRLGDRLELPKGYRVTVHAATR